MAKGKVQIAPQLNKVSEVIDIKTGDKLDKVKGKVILKKAEFKPEEEPKVKPTSFENKLQEKIEGKINEMIDKKIDSVLDNMFK